MKYTKELTGYFRVNPTSLTGNQWELAIYKKGFAQADFKDRVIIGLFNSQSDAYRAIENVLITFEFDTNEN